MKSYSQIKEVKLAQEKKLMEKQNVVGVGIGRKIVEGEITDEIVVRIYVEKKVAESRLSAKSLIPKTIDNVKTDVIAIGKIRFQNQKSRNRPTQGGDSAGSCHSLKYGYIMTGTLGVSLIDKTDGKEVLLSNNHVFADCDSDAEKRAKVGDLIVQPGTLDGGSCKNDVIGTLKRWASFNATGDNEIDAAIADLTNPADASECVIGCDIGKVNGYRILTESDEKLKVQKCGRTTGYTTGEVMDVDFSGKVGYEILTSSGVVEKEYLFINQILLSAMSDSGDSGSLILDMDEKAVGLLFAGSDQVTLANRIEKVLSILKLELCPRIDLCVRGGPSCKRSGPTHCIVGGPENMRCVVGGPGRHCIAGPDIRCIAGGPENMSCIVGGPNKMVIECPGPFIDLCHAGPDIAIGCGGGPDIEVFDPQNPIIDPERWIFIKGDKIPEAMKKSFINMLKKMMQEK